MSTGSTQPQQQSTVQSQGSGKTPQYVLWNPNINKFLLGGLVLIVGGIVGYWGGKKLGGYQKPSPVQTTSVKRSELEEKAEDKIVKKIHYTISQNNDRTYFTLDDDKKTGKTLEQFEEEVRENLQKKYDEDRDEINSRYDKMKEDSHKEARKAWGFNDEKKEPVVESSDKPTEKKITNFYEEIRKLNKKYIEKKGVKTK